MHLTIAFSGPAGTGANTSGFLLADLLASKGYSIRADKEYASIIKGDNNSFIISLSDQEKISLTKAIDLFFAFDQFSVDKNQSIYELKQVISLVDIKSPKKNMFAFGAGLASLKMQLEEIKRWLAKKHPNFNTPQNLTEIEAGFAWFSSLPIASTCRTDENAGSCFSLSNAIGDPKVLKLGNQLIAEGAIDAGLEFYSYYPMTPVTGIVDTIMDHPEITCFQ